MKQEGKKNLEIICGIDQRWPGNNGKLKFYRYIHI